MANLEETHEAELDAILGELSILEQRSTNTNTNDKNVVNGCPQNNQAITTQQAPNITTPARNGRTHSRSNSTISGATNSSISISSESGNGSGSDSSGPARESRTDSPDNDSAFSDTVSLLSSESSASSGVSASAAAANNAKNIIPMNSNLLQVSEHLLSSKRLNSFR